MNKAIVGAATVAALMCGFAMPVMASSPTVYKWENGIKAIPTEFTKDNAPKVYTYTREESNGGKTYEFSIFDENFQEVKTFRTSLLPEAEATSYSQERKYEYKVVNQTYVGETGDYIDIDGETAGISEEQALEWVRSRYGRGDVTTLPDGKSAIVVEFWHEWEIGQKYPNRYFAKNGDGVWVCYFCEYEGEDYGPYGDWGEVRENPNSVSCDLSEYEILNFVGADEGYCHLSQSLFGNDDHFEYLIPVLEEESFSFEDEHQKIWGTKISVKGIRVMNDNNEEVMTFEFPAGYTCQYYDADVTVISMGGKRYVSIDVEKEGENEDYTVIYRLDEESGLPSQVAVKPSTKVSPRTPMRGEQVTVTLGENAAKSGCNVNVVSANGQTVMRSRVAAGESTFNIDTARLQKGVYVVTVNTANSSTEAAKIVVR